MRASASIGTPSGFNASRPPSKIFSISAPTPTICDPAVSAKWREANIQDDPVRQSNRRGMISFATAGPNTRTTQVFINFGDNSNLDGMGFAPFGRVISGMNVVDALYAGYGEGAPRGRGPDQGRLQMQGNAYLIKNYPRMDYIKKATVER